MVKNVKAECHPATNIDGIIKRWLNRGQKYVAAKGPKGGWPWLRQYGYTLTTASGTSAYALSPLVDTSKLITFYETSSPQHIGYMSEQEFRMREPGPTATGVPYLYRLKGFSPVQNQPSSASAIAISSSSASDTAVDVNIQGLDSSNVFTVEKKTLTGTTPVSTTTTFTKILGVSKDASSVGKVTLTSNSGGVTNLVLAAYDRAASHPIVDFFTIPSSTLTIYYDFTLKLPNIYGDDDISLLPEQYHDAPELYAKTECFKHLNNSAMAQLTFQQLESRIKDMRDECYQPNGVWSLDSVDAPRDVIEARLPASFPRWA
jgi:hypothetical protein